MVKTDIIRQSIDLGGFNFVKSFDKHCILIRLISDNPTNDKEEDKMVVLYTLKHGRPKALAYRGSIKESYTYKCIVFKESELSVIDEISNADLMKSSQHVTVKQSDIEKDFESIVIKASNEGTSDIHICVKDSFNTTIEFRIAGTKQHYFSRSTEHGHQMISTVMGYLLKQSASTTYQKNTRQSGTHELTVGDSLFRLRLESFPIEGGMKLVARIAKLDTKGGAAIKFEDAGYLDNQILQIRAALMAPSGAVIIAGTTGSGKTTTLQAMASEILMDKGVELISVEDPVELLIKGASQMSVSSAMPFDECLKAMMRGDPDIIMIGEIRDPLSAYTAAQAAITGHKVLTTTHAGSPIAINLRLEGFNVPRHVLGSADFYQLAMYQKLVKHTCTHCSEQFGTPVANKLAVKYMRSEAAWKAAQSRWSAVFDNDTKWGNRAGNILIHNASGCSKCSGGLIRKMSVVAELMTMDDVMLEYISEKKDNHAVSHWLERGGVSKFTHVTEKVVAGDVCPLIAEKCTGAITYDIIREDHVIDKSEIHQLGGYVEDMV